MCCGYYSFPKIDVTLGYDELAHESVKTIGIEMHITVDYISDHVNSRYASMWLHYDMRNQ